MNEGFFMTGMNLDVHAAWTRRRRTANTLQTQYSRTVALSVQNPCRTALQAELSAQNLGAETAKKHTHQ